jgi:hypothetical protein
VLRWRAVPPKTCPVTVKDVRGVRHLVEVVAESLLRREPGAVCPKEDCLDGGAGNPARSSVQEPVVKHTLSVQQITRMLNVTRTITPHCIAREEAKGAQ